MGARRGSERAWEVGLEGLPVCPWSQAFLSQGN